MTIRVKSTSTFHTQKSSPCRLTHCTELYVRCRGAVAAFQYRAGRCSRWYWIFMPSPHLLNLGKNRAQLRIAVDWNYHGCRLTSVTHIVFPALQSPYLSSLGFLHYDVVSRDICSKVELWEWLPTWKQRYGQAHQRYAWKPITNRNQW